MTSLPPQRQRCSQSRQSSPEASSSGQDRKSSLPQSTTSEDSQTVLLSHPSSSDSSPKPEAQPKQKARPDLQTAESMKEPRKCWICFADETEDTPTSSEWRSPCPCSLTAHEACLLDYVADLEAPQNRKSSGPPKIECPQCKAKITIARPRSLVVEGVRAVQRATARFILPFTFVTLAGTVVTGCWMHGFSTIYLLFGPEDAERLLGIDNNAGINSKWALGLPFIPLALIAARTRYADNLLPILPIFYFASTGPQRDGPLWPPSASMTVAILPYIRAAYNEFYDRVCAPREKAWIKQIQPRAGDDNEGNEEREQHQDQANEFEDGMDIGLDLQVEIVEDREGHEDGQPPGNAPEEQGRANRGQDQGLVLNNFFSLPQTIMGALLFPSISAAVGALLQVTLPRSWTTAPSRWDRHPVGFLQSRFGRSIVGGCLFVVLKDTLMLYSRYRLAQDHKKRRVVDYDAKKEKKSTSTHL
ncbi:RING finger domain protein [Usnea florida]